VEANHSFRPFVPAKLPICAIALINSLYSAHRYVGHPPPSRIDAQGRILPPNLLTEHNFNLHRLTHGRPGPQRQKWVAWLSGVVDAMQKGELEDAMHNSWDLYSDPERRVVDPKDRPDDEWDNTALQRRFRSQSIPVETSSER
jgi:hypothetical protein